MQFVFQLMMKLMIHVTHLKAVRVESTSLLRESLHKFLKKIAKIVPQRLTYAPNFACLYHVLNGYYTMKSKERQ